jgi:Na+/glutamate symporter
MTITKTTTQTLMMMMIMSLSLCGGHGDRANLSVKISNNEQFHSMTNSLK